jgi:hypothetical protein
MLRVRAQLIDELNRATAALAVAQAQVRYLRHVAPTNLVAARARFLAAYPAADAVDPIFEYAPLPPDPAQALREAAGQLPSSQPWRALLEERLESVRQGYAALLCRDPAEMTAYTLRQFGTPDEATTAAAVRDLAAASPTHAEDGAAVWSAEQARSVLAAVLHRAGLAGWSAEVPEHMVARMSVLGPERQVRVRRDAEFSTPELRRLIVHEIGTHAFRSANAQRQQLALLGVGSAGYLSTEEGLAAWHEREAGLASQDVRRRYALRYLASRAALDGGLRAVVDRLVGHTTVAEAFDLAARVKRGLVDTSAPGGFIKDQVYFGGLTEVHGYLAAHPEDYDLLMASKWSLGQIPLLRELRAAEVLLPPTYRVDRAIELAHELTTRM